MSAPSGSTLSSCCNWSMTAIGWLGRPCIAAIMSPSSGRLLISPTTVLFGTASVWTSLVRSYSRKRSRSGEKNGMTCWSSVELVAGETEIDLVALAVERHRLEPERDRAVLDIGERLRVVGFEPDLAVRRGDVLVEQLAHPRGVDAIGGDLVAEPVRIIEAQGDRLVDLGERVPGPRRQGVEMLGGQIDPRREKTADDDVGRDQDQRDADERRDATHAGGESRGRIGGVISFGLFEVDEDRVGERGTRP